jgi:hypothetical protein
VKQTVQEQSDKQVHFEVRGRHPNLYAVDIPDVLDEDIKDELLIKVSITLLKHLVRLVDEDTEAAKTKHAHSKSNVSEPESVALSLSSSAGGSVDADGCAAVHDGVAEYVKRVESWRNSASGFIPEQPESVEVKL